jgi:two-component system, oxyanion-binding sensor
MIDCAALVAARELGLFQKHGLNVSLKKELGWGTIRERLVHGELHAAHAPASLAYAIQCGIGGVARPCVTAFIFSLHGGSITLSQNLWRIGVRDLSSLRAKIAEHGASRKFRFGVVLEVSAEAYLLRRWLASGGIDPDRDVSITTVSCRTIHQQLLDAHLDGYCVPEPWNSVAVQNGAGWIAATADEIEPGHPGNALLVLEQLANRRPEDHLALVAALLEASTFCENLENRRELISMLARPEYIDVSPDVLTTALIEKVDGRLPEKSPIFFGRGVHRPDRKKARQITQSVQSLLGPQHRAKLRADILRRVFREDLYDRAIGGASEVRAKASGRVGRALPPTGRPDAGSPLSSRVTFAG